MVWPGMLSRNSRKLLIAPVALPRSIRHSTSSAVNSLPQGEITPLRR